MGRKLVDADALKKKFAAQIDKIAKEKKYGWEFTVNGFNGAIFITGVEAAKNGVGWIPCSERLPEEDVDVLISYRYKEGEGDTSHVHIDITSYGDMYFGGNPVHDSVTGDRVKHWRQPFAYFTSNYEIIAWMSLPEPYAERRQDETD